jgi:hypothetical protein
MTPVTPSSVCDMQEREAFEAAYVAEFYAELPDIKLRKRDMAGSERLGEYTRDHTQSCWIMWQARAALAERTQQEALTDEHRELYFAAYALCDSMCEDHPAISDVFDINSHGRLCNALAKLDAAYGVTSPDDRITADHSTAPMQPSGSLRGSTWGDLGDGIRAVLEPFIGKATASSIGSTTNLQTRPIA